MVSRAPAPVVSFFGIDSSSLRICLLKQVVNDAMRVY
jgi:hypothetical protein